MSVDIDRWTEYQLHVLTLGDQVDLWLAVVVCVHEDSVEAVHLDKGSSEQYLRWPDCEYATGELVACIAPPDDVAVAVPVADVHRRARLKG